MALLGKAGQETATDVNQFVHSWLDEARRSVTELLQAVAGHRVKFDGEFRIEKTEDKEKPQP